MIACLTIAGFELRAALRRRPRLALRPAALSPAEVPLGVVTAFFGAPFFAVVLRTTRAGSR
jgi:ABC-type Fe3+-siderophore transport system permease subunit